MLPDAGDTLAWSTGAPSTLPARSSKRDRCNGAVGLGIAEVARRVANLDDVAIEELRRRPSLEIDSTAGREGYLADAITTALRLAGSTDMGSRPNCSWPKRLETVPSAARRASPLSSLAVLNQMEPSSAHAAWAVAWILLGTGLGAPPVIAYR